MFNMIYGRAPVAGSGPGDWPDGAAQDVGPEETAVARRDARFVVNIVGVWSDEADDDPNIGWVRGYYAAAHPHSARRRRSRNGLIALWPLLAGRSRTRS